MKRVIWTRPAEDWEEDMKILKPLHRLLRFPVTRQIECNVQLPQKPCDIVILTSRKAAEAFLHRSHLSRDALHKIEFVTFGMETYKFLLSSNLRTRLIPAAGARQFAEILTADLKKGSTVWFPRPLETAFPLGDYLRTHGIETFDIELYRTEAIKNIEQSLIQQLLEESSVVCFASPSAVKAFVDIVRVYDEARFYRYTPVVIGPTTKASGQSYFNEIFVSQASNLVSLWEKAVEIARQQNDV